MQWDHIRTFLAVANSGTVSQAALDLGVNHATVIRRLQMLEQDLGLRLFERLQSGYLMTEQAQALLPQAVQMQLAAQALELQSKAAEQIPQGKLKLSLPEPALLNYSPLLAQFSSTFKRIELELNSTTTTSNLNKLEADVVLRLTNQPPQTWVGSCIGELEFGIFASPEFLQQAKNLAPETCPWLLWRGVQTAGVMAAQQPDVLFLRQFQAPHVVMRAFQVGDILLAAQQGMGVALLAKPAAKAAGLTELPWQELLQPAGLDRVQVWMLTHKNLRFNMRVKTFMDFTKQYKALLFS